MSSETPLRSPSLEASDESGGDLHYAHAAGLELERKLYGNAIAAVDQVFAKEGLIAAFLTSGALIAYTGCLGAFAQVAPKVGRIATIATVAALAIALAVLVRSAFLVRELFEGREVDDIDDSTKLLQVPPIPATRVEVDLAMMVTYRSARERHEALVKSRLESLFMAMGWAGSGTLLSFLAILVAFGSVALHQQPLLPGGVAPLSNSAYNKDMAKNHDAKPSTGQPQPVIFPQDKGGTPMIKGGGGNGKPKPAAGLKMPLSHQRSDSPSIAGK
jgi:hypothetical protein